MRHFALLYERLDLTNSTNEKVELLVSFFRDKQDASAAWVLWLLTGRTLGRVLSARDVAHWVQEASGVPRWLFRECYSSVGDLAETIALIMESHHERIVENLHTDQLPSQQHSSLMFAPPSAQLNPHSTLHAPVAEDPARTTESLSLETWITEQLELLRIQDQRGQRRLVLAWLCQLTNTERFLLIKLLTGSLRVGVSQTLVVRALSQIADISQADMAHRLAGTWKPHKDLIPQLLSTQSQAPSDDQAGLSRPYPFYLATSLAEAGVDEANPNGEGWDKLGSTHNWHLEWKWDGIRAQIICRGGEVFIWSRGDELLTSRFPELTEFAARFPSGTVIDGEIVGWKAGRVADFSLLQKRITRTSLSRKILEQAPVAFIAYDMLEYQGQDQRTTPLHARRALLESCITAVQSPRCMISELLKAPTWTDAHALRSTSREKGVEGLMIKARDSTYESGRVRGSWWKWKISPMTFDGVLVYAEPGHGRRANLLTDYTFAVWDEQGQLVPVARAYSGLTDPEIIELDGWIRNHLVSRFGPIRTVQPLRVFELAFEGIARSTRHKGGVAMRFPRILRERTDKAPQDADTLSRLKTLARVAAHTGGSGQMSLFDPTHAKPE